MTRTGHDSAPAGRAYERMSGERGQGHSFYQDYTTFRASRPSADPTGMGEDFDFDDAAEMSARLPRLSRLFRGERRV